LKFEKPEILLVLKLHVKIYPLGGVCGDQQPPLFILAPPSYLRN